MDGKVEGRWRGTSLCDNEVTTASRTNAAPGLRGEALGADTTGPTVASRYISYFSRRGPIPPYTHV